MLMIPSTPFSITVLFFRIPPKRPRLKVSGDAAWHRVAVEIAPTTYMSCLLPTSVEDLVRTGFLPTDFIGPEKKH